MRKMFKSLFATVLVLLFLLLPEAACAENNDGPDAPAKRTILLYVCGTNLETNNAMASYNLRQILQAKFSEDDDINVIVMTGGANRWHLESKYLAFPDNVNLPKDAVANDDGQSVDPTSQISNIYNQIWEARGADAKENAGHLVLLDGDGITDTKSKKSEEEPVIDPATLKTFINYGVTNYPADKYDLILWNHGDGSELQGNNKQDL